MKREAGNKLDYEAFSGAAAELPRVKQVTNWIQGRRPRLWVSRSMLKDGKVALMKSCFCLLGPGDGIRHHFHESESSKTAAV